MKIINNYWTRLSKISWFVSGEQFNYLPKPSSIIVLSFDHQDCFHILITSWQLREAICHFSLENVVPITHEQNIICRKARLDGTPHEQTIICRQLFAGHVVDSRPMERKKKTHRMIIALICCALRSPKVTLITVFVSSYLQVTWWTLGQLKGRKNALNDN